MGERGCLAPSLTIPKMIILGNDKNERGYNH